MVSSLRNHAIRAVVCSHCNAGTKPERSLFPSIVLKVKAVGSCQRRFVAKSTAHRARSVSTQPLFAWFRSRRWLTLTVLRQKQQMLLMAPCMVTRLEPVVFPVPSGRLSRTRVVGNWPGSS